MVLNCLSHSVDAFLIQSWMRFRATSKVTDGIVKPFKHIWYIVFNFFCTISNQVIFVILLVTYNEVFTFLFSCHQSVLRICRLCILNTQNSVYLTSASIRSTFQSISYWHSIKICKSRQVVSTRVWCICMLRFRYICTALNDGVQVDGV